MQSIDLTWFPVHLVWFVFLLLFYVLATCKSISGWVPTCDIAHSWRLNSVTSLGYQATSYSTQSHYPDTEPTSPCSILIMSSARLGSDKLQFLSHWFDSTSVRTRRVQIQTHGVRIPWSSSTSDRRSTHSATTSDLCIRRLTWGGQCASLH